MSQENLRIVRETFGRFETNDPDFRDFSHWDDVVVTPPEGWPESGEIRGLDAWRRQANVSAIPGKTPASRLRRCTPSEMSAS